MKRFSKPYSSDSFDYENASSDYYDDIVDKSEFRPDSETIRGLKLSVGSGVTDKGLYDYSEGKIPDVDTVTPELIALRNGKLDKADVQKLSQEADEALKESMSNAEREKLLAEKEAINNARQSFLDEQTGFDPNSINKEV